MKWDVLSQIGFGLEQENARITDKEEITKVTQMNIDNFCDNTWKIITENLQEAALEGWSIEFVVNTFLLYLS